MKTLQECKDEDVYYIERTDLIDIVQTEDEAKRIVDKLNRENNDERHYDYSPKSSQFQQPTQEKEQLTAQELKDHSLPTKVISNGVEMDIVYFKTKLLNKLSPQPVEEWKTM